MRRSRTTLQDMTFRGSQDTSFLSYSVNTRFQDTLLWLHPCGPIVDRLRRSTVGSGTREDVATAYELPVLHEVVYIAPVPAVFAAPALAVRSACTSGLRHRSALAVIAASAPVMEYVGLCSDPRTCARGRVQRTSLQFLYSTCASVPAVFTARARVVESGHQLLQTCTLRQRQS